MCLPEFKLMLMAHNRYAIDRSDSVLWMKQNLRGKTHTRRIAALEKKTANCWRQHGLPPVSAHATNVDYGVNIIKLTLDNDSTDQKNMNLTRIYWKEKQEADAS